VRWPAEEHSDINALGPVSVSEGDPTAAIARDPPMPAVADQAKQRRRKVLDCSADAASHGDNYLGPPAPTAQLRVAPDRATALLRMDCSSI